jgi:hypothetical protein
LRVDVPSNQEFVFQRLNIHTTPSTWPATSAACWPRGHSEPAGQIAAEIEIVRIKGALQRAEELGDDVARIRAIQKALIGRCLLNSRDVHVANSLLDLLPVELSQSMK